MQRALMQKFSGAGQGAMGQVMGQITGQTRSHSSISHRFRHEGNERRAR